jgi:hypothetical protein
MQFIQFIHAHLRIEMPQNGIRTNPHPYGQDIMTVPRMRHQKAQWIVDRSPSHTTLCEAVIRMT